MAKNKRLQQLVLLSLSVILVSSLIFTGLYRYNNKYTAAGVQPISGLLVLDAQELADVPVHYLIRDWECYPNQLFTPADFNKGTPQVYRQYVSIGQYGGMELGQRSRSPHGSATYRLMLDLPAQEAYYALRIPPSTLHTTCMWMMSCF